MKYLQHRRNRGFTLVELLVVIGIIAILISVLLPVLNNARRAGYKVKCLANLKSLGDAYKLYATDTKGFWGPAWIQYTRSIPPGTVGSTCDKRWFDFVAKYVVGNQMKAKYGTDQMNWNGTQLTSIEPQLWSEPMWHGDNALWGCPVWERVGRDAAGNAVHVDQGNAIFWPGYLQNPYPFAPVYTPKTEAFVTALPPPRNMVPPGFYKYTQYKRQGERALLFEAVSHTFSPISAGLGTTWQFKPEGPKDWPKTPDIYFCIDFNRHGRYRTGNKPTDPSLNVLFCDGHASTLSARETWRAIMQN